MPALIPLSSPPIALGVGISHVGMPSVGTEIVTTHPARTGSFEDWLDPHWRGMAMLARRMVGEPDWEDVAQEAVAAAWRKWDQFDQSRGSPRSWLLAIVADQAAKHRRKRRPEPSAVVVDARTAEDDPAESRIDVDAALRVLTARQYLAVTLHYFLGVPLAEIAQVMGCGVGTVKSTLRDARDKLRPLLGADR